MQSLESTFLPLSWEKLKLQSRPRALFQWQSGKERPMRPPVDPRGWRQSREDLWLGAAGQGLAREGDSLTMSIKVLLLPPPPPPPSRPHQGVGDTWNSGCRALGKPRWGVWQEDRAARAVSRSRDKRQPSCPSDTWLRTPSPVGTSVLFGALLLEVWLGEGGGFRPTSGNPPAVLSYV